MLLNKLNISVIIFLLLELFIARALADCNSSNEKLDCSYASLVRLPKVGRNVKLFNASHNKIPHLKRDSFYRLVKIGQVVTDFNGSRTINQYIFTGQSQLEVIDLSWNVITFIHPDAFVFTSKLKWLSLAYNSALRLPENGLFSLGKSLLILYLNHCNISNINEHTFKSGEHYLKELYLDHNSIMTVDDNAFASFKMLQILDLSKNRIKYFQFNSVSPLVHLKCLHLQNNPLECNCLLQTLYLWSNVQKIKLDNVTCRTSDGDNILEASELVYYMKCTTRSTRTRRHTVTNSGPETKSSDSDSSSLVLIIIAVLAAVLFIACLCACLLNNAHECTEAAGWLLICHHCYQ